jgi:diguanylate cyclase (GGDEF)-like protein/PAS domain S-box-containing protein
MLSDITERKQTEIALKESEERYRIAIEASNDGIAIVQNDAHVYVNQSFLTMFGYSALEEIVGKQNYCIVHPDHKERVIEYARARQKGEHAPTRYEFKGIKKDGTPVDIEVSVNTISYNGKQAILAYLRDNTERKKTENDLIYLGTHDPLTGLFNRTFFQTELERLQDSRLYPISIIMADVNGLKDVNDHLGHLAGDELLREVGSVIHKTFRAEEIIARIGGDEFVILLPGIDQTGAEKAIIRLQVHIAEHNHTNPDLQISLAAGYATGEANIALEELLHLADNEMYRIKAIQKQIKLEDKVL